jgi:hypothetical protein
MRLQLALEIAGSDIQVRDGISNKGTENYLDNMRDGISLFAFSRSTVMGEACFRTQPTE